MAHSFITTMPNERTGIEQEEFNLHFDGSEHLSLGMTRYFSEYLFMNLLEFDRDAEFVKVEVIETYEGALEEGELTPKGYVDNGGERFIAHRKEVYGDIFQLSFSMNGPDALGIDFYYYQMPQAMHCRADFRITAYYKNE